MGAAYHATGVSFEPWVGSNSNRATQAKLGTFLIAKTGTPNEAYEASFYGAGALADAGRCCVVTIAEYTRQFIIDQFGFDGTTQSNAAHTMRVFLTTVSCVQASHSTPHTHTHYFA